MARARSDLVEQALVALPEIRRSWVGAWDVILSDANAHAEAKEPLRPVHFCDDPSDKTGKPLVGYWEDEHEVPVPIIPAAGGAAIQGCFAESSARAA